MALPPTIPTSFVPKQPVATTGKKRTSGANPFLALSYFVLAIALLGAAGTFGYQYYLTGMAKSKAAQVQAAQNSIDQDTVSQFIRLRDRFTAAEQVLDDHVVLSQFFTDLENLTLAGVRFSTLSIDVNDDRSADLELAGTAKSFNTLAAQSQSFATDSRIKRAIFSGITTDPKDSSISFTVSATLDPSLIELGTAGASAPVVPTTTAPPAQTATSSAVTTQTTTSSTTVATTTP